MVYSMTCQNTWYVKSSRRLHQVRDYVKSRQGWCQLRIMTSQVKNYIKSQVTQSEGLCKVKSGFCQITGYIKSRIMSSHVKGYVKSRIISGHRSRQIRIMSGHRSFSFKKMNWISLYVWPKAGFGHFCSSGYSLHWCQTTAERDASWEQQTAAVCRQWNGSVKEHRVPLFHLDNRFVFASYLGNERFTTPTKDPPKTE